MVVSELEGPRRPEGFDGLPGRIDAKGTATATATSGSISGYLGVYNTLTSACVLSPEVGAG